MYNIFINEKLIEPTSLQKFFKISPKMNAFIEVNNLLASRPLEDITSYDILTISKKYNVNLRRRFINKLKELYLQYLGQFISDDKISDLEQLHLNKLKSLLNLRDSEVEELHIQVVKEIYEKSYNEVIADGKIEKAETELLDELHKNLRLPTDVIEQISIDSRKEFLQNQFNKISSDGEISPQEWEELVLIAHNLDVEIELNDANKSKVEKLKMYWHIEHGELPVKNVSVNLQQNEICYYSANIEWLENRTVTKRINYEGPYARIKIVKGIYYRAGSMGVRRITTDQLLTVDSGKVYLTNKRIIFTGKKKNFNIRFNKILSINPYSDGVEIEKDSGKSPIFKFDRDADIFAMILTRLINDPQISE